jgi:hypothetical protein
VLGAGGADKDRRWGRGAAKASSVEQQTLDMALQRFTRRAAEAAQGTGEAKDALAQMDVALSDQSGNLRRSKDLPPTSPMPSHGSQTRPRASDSPSSCSTPRAWRWPAPIVQLRAHAIGCMAAFWFVERVGSVLSGAS